MRPQRSMGFGEKMLQAQECGQNLVWISHWRKGNAGNHFEKVQKIENSQSIQEHQCTWWAKKDLSSDELDTLRRSRNPFVAVTVYGEVQTNEEAQVYVHDLDLFVTVQLLEETLAVLSLGKLCEDHGYSYEWVSLYKLENDSSLAVGES